MKHVMTETTSIPMHALTAAKLQAAATESFKQELKPVMTETTSIPMHAQTAAKLQAAATESFKQGLKPAMTETTSIPDACTNSCEAATCGDGIIQTGVEACDDGNNVDTDACTNSCEVASCGDGIIQTGVEACDDGNNVDTDACTNSCTVAVCGDGVVQTGVEACDDGNNVDTDACTNSCMIASCGDGIVQTGVEACDDGNNIDTDSCTNSCTVAACGDGVVQTGVEACDDGNNIDTDSCTNSCMPASCGDGIVQTGVEACDDGNNIDTDACTNSCDAASCGDGIVQTGVEACDDGNNIDTDSCTNSCTTAACGDGVVQAGVEACDDGNDIDTDACTNSCKAAVCGDGIVQAGVETCDDGNSVDTDSCPNSCISAFCGDGIVQEGVEECDDGNTDNTDACLNTCIVASCDDDFVQKGVEDCDPNNPDLDIDGDGTPNCVEIEDGTDVCDAGSVVPKLDTSACSPGANFFFSQTNIATVVNHLSTPLSVTVDYRDWFGIVKGSVTFSLDSFLKRDVIINELGAEADTYGTVCVYTDAEDPGSWSGALTVYKSRFTDDSLDAEGMPTAIQGTFDYALHYPFQNPRTGVSVSNLNTNTLGTTGDNDVASWVRVTDAKPDDGMGLTGTIYYSAFTGEELGSHEVNLPDGGRFDFPAHEIIGQKAVGAARFVPTDSSAPYYFESSRYFYEASVQLQANFWTAFVVPNPKPTGAKITGRVSNLASELSIIESLNATDQDTTANITIFGFDGVETFSQSGFITGNGALHTVINDQMLPAGTIGSAQISGALESLSSVSLVYRFDALGILTYAYAPPFLESAGKTQVFDWNSFLNQKNTVEIFNTSDTRITGVLEVIDYLNNTISVRDVDLEARAATSFVLDELPVDSYGTLLLSVDSIGIVGQNSIERENEYKYVTVGR